LERNDLVLASIGDHLRAKYCNVFTAGLAQALVGNSITSILTELGGKALQAPVVSGVTYSGELFYPYAPLAVLG